MPHALDGRAAVLGHVVLVEHGDERLVLVHLAARLLQRRRVARGEGHAAGWAGKRRVRQWNERHRRRTSRGGGGGRGTRDGGNFKVWEDRMMENKMMVVVKKSS